MDSRAALRAAFQTIEKHIEPAADSGEENPLRTKDFRHIFTQLLTAISDEEADPRITSWDEVRGLVPVCVAYVPTLGETAEAATALVTDIVNHAEKLAPTYVSPPPYV